MELDLDDWATKQLVYRMWATTSYAEFCELWYLLKMDGFYLPLDIARRAAPLTTNDIGERHPLFSGFVLAQDPTASHGIRWVFSAEKGN